MVKVVCIGDSITAGQFLPNNQNSWPELILGHEIKAVGVSSDTTRLGLERFPRDVQEQLPQAVVIQFGHNDANRWQTDRELPRVSVRAYEANLMEMVTRCRAFEATPFLCSLTPCFRSKRHAADVEFYDAVLRGVARGLGVHLIDARLAFEEQAWRELLLTDGLHLNAAGHRVYAETVQEALDAWL